MTNSKPICSISECGKPVSSRGYCSTHYTRWRTHGDPLFKLTGNISICTVDSCDVEHSALGYCKRHYGSFKRHGDAKEIDRREERKQYFCSIDGCDSKYFCLGYCRKHYERWRKSGDAGFTSVTPRGDPMKFVQSVVKGPGVTQCILWPYGTTKKTNGYGRISVNGKKVLVSRYVLSITAGPPPTPHHQACHAPIICHNRLCINPLHLRWATPKENMADKVLDGTSNFGRVYARLQPKKIA